MKIKTQNEEIVETNRDIGIYGTKHMKKQLLELGTNSAM